MMKTRSSMGLIAFCLSVIGMGGADTAQAQPPVSTGPAIMSIDSLLSVFVLREGQQFRTDLVSKDSLTSIHLTQVRGGIESHKHLKHHETVWVIRGAGRLLLNGTKKNVAAGEMVNIPPGTSHSFHSLGVVPTVVISVFSPAFDGSDRVYDNPKGN